MSEPIPTDDSLQFFDSRDQAAALALSLISEARREICIFGTLIDPVLYDNDAVVAELSAFARRSPRSQIRIVVLDSHKNVVNSHRLLPLAQKLTSSIEIRIAAKTHQDLPHQFLLIDTRGYLYCPNAGRYEGRAKSSAPAEVRDLRQEFEQIWEQARPDINTRLLHL